jgi:hypothetical protein
MEKAKKSTRKAAPDTSAERITKAYQEHLLLHGHQPATVYRFCHDLGIQEEDFYKVAGSFQALEKHIWAEYIHSTIKRLDADEDFDKFSAREKLLAFYFTLLEMLKANRSFCLVMLGRHDKLEVVPAFLKSFKTTFEEFVDRILNNGKATGEVAVRPFIDKRYPQLFWLHMAFLLVFWKEDDSAGFEKTDAFIEKSVNLAFDLIGKGAVDTAIDFGKFLYQSRMN